MPALGVEPAQADVDAVRTFGGAARYASQGHDQTGDKLILMGHMGTQNAAGAVTHAATMLATANANGSGGNNNLSAKLLQYG